MSYYMSMQAVRFRSPDDYGRFLMLFREAIKAASKVPGFVNVNWWVHAADPELFLETSMWESKDATEGWHADGFHKHLKQWGSSGPIIEDTVTNWVSEESKILRVCPVCSKGISRPFEIRGELKDKAVPCECGFNFPYLTTTDKFAVFTG